jgi:hypothetical protein
MAALTGHAGHIDGNGIDAPEIVQEPGVEPFRNERFGDRADIKSVENGRTLVRHFRNVAFLSIAPSPTL